MSMSLAYKFYFSRTCYSYHPSLFANQHNHELRPDAFEFSSKYRELSKEMIDEIEIMTKYGNLSITLQRNLLKARFPKMNCSDSDLSNAIQRFKSLRDRSNMHDDASDLLINLVQKKQEDPRFFVKFELDNDNWVTRLFWMTPEQVVLWIKYHDVIINDNMAKTNNIIIVYL